MVYPASQSHLEKDRCHALFESCKDLIVILDRSWSIVYSNPAFKLKISDEPAVEGTNFLSLLDHAFQDKMHEVRDILFREGGHIEIPLRFNFSDGQRTLVAAFLFSPTRVAEGGEPLLGGIGRDRTADLALLKEVIELNIELEKKQGELFEANARIEQIAQFDEITQLHNRHYFFPMAQHFWEESRRDKNPMVAVLMDIDDFKLINDTHGHLFGDYVLQELSLRLRTVAPKMALLARYGGEELVLVLPRTDMASALPIAEEFRAAVCARPYVMGGCSANVTISIGVSGTELEEFKDFYALLASSDRALYSAKHAGKNCVYVHKVRRKYNRTE